MTIHAPHRVEPARLDLHLASAQVATTAERQQRWWQLGALGMALVQGLLWFMIGHGGTKGLAWGGAAVGGFVLLHVLSLVVDGWRDRREEGPAGPGPSSLGQVTSQAIGHDIWVAAHAALAAQGFSRPWRLDSNTVEASIVPMWRGRRFLTVRVEGAGPRGAVVTVWGHPDTSLNGALNDGGLSRRATNRVLAAIPGGTPVG